MILISEESQYLQRIPEFNHSFLTNGMYLVCLDKLLNGVTLMLMALKYLLRSNLFNAPLPLYNIWIVMITDAHFVALLDCPACHNSSGRARIWEDCTVRTEGVIKH